jgi:YHS domain-containing protein
LKSLLWLVIFGGLFFVMMRYGCGAHIGGHRHGGRGERESGSGATAKDPVCGMSVDPQQAKAASVHRGTTYYFCSASCRDKFEQAPKNTSVPQRRRNCRGSPGRATTASTPRRRSTRRSRKSSLRCSSAH